MSKERLQAGIANQFDLDAAVAQFQAAVARKGCSVLDQEKRKAVERARQHAHEVFDKMLDLRAIAIAEMLKPKSERKVG